MIAHPPCTYLTIAAEWLYKDSIDKKLKPGTLFGEARREARREAAQFIWRLWNSGIPKICIENPGEFPLSAEELHEKLEGHAFTSCGSEQRESIGWVPPLGKNTETLAHSVNGCILIRLAMQERLLPASVIKDELEERVAEIQERESRKVGGKEKKDLREQIEFDLLPKAFTRTKYLDAWIDASAGWLVVNTASATQAETLTGMLRKTIGSLPVIAPETAITPISLLTHWLQDSTSMPAVFDLGMGAELVGAGEERSKVTFKAHELQAEEVQANLDHGKQVSQLELIWRDRISFKLDQHLQIKGLKFLDVFDDQLDGHDPQSHAEKIDIEFALMSGEVRELLSDLMAAFNPDISWEDATAATFGTK
ncbi:unnamed protein product [Cyprideis torosa]|uniref:Uncharacterized protein n=1 Tax=Cyprideis torosa TaxID=163714 RepID=A0A7R8WF27_9CRUS|nr:unnamed protein product [Cyprideis torosa]CAG0896359.1 unnamed protein product [Cyprideis torosa]